MSIQVLAWPFSVGRFYGYQYFRSIATVATEVSGNNKIYFFRKDCVGDDFFLVGFSTLHLRSVDGMVVD